MTEDEYLTGKLTNKEIDKLADAGDYRLEEQRFKYWPNQYDLQKAAEDGERLLGELKVSHYSQQTLKQWSVARQPGGLWEIRLNGKLYVENGKAAIFRTENDAHRAVNRIFYEGQQGDNWFLENRD